MGGEIRKCGTKTEEDLQKSNIVRVVGDFGAFYLSRFIR